MTIPWIESRGQPVNESTLQSLLDRVIPALEGVNLLEWAIGYIEESGFIPDATHPKAAQDRRLYLEAKAYLTKVRGE